MAQFKSPRKPEDGDPAKKERQARIRLSQEEYEKLRNELEQALVKAVNDPIVEAGEELQAFRDAMVAEGVTPRYTAKLLRYLIERHRVAKWNPDLKVHELFVDGELMRRCLDMIAKIFGGYNQPHVNFSVNLDLEKILTDPNKSPAQALRDLQNSLYQQMAQLGQPPLMEGRRVFPRNLLPEYAEKNQLTIDEAIKSLNEQGYEVPEPTEVTVDATVIDPS